MTYKALLKRLQEMTPEQLSQRAVLLAGCSGDWTTVDSVFIARKDEYPEECAPGERRHKEFVDEGFAPPDPAVRKGNCYIIHDH